MRHLPLKREICLHLSTAETAISDFHCSATSTQHPPPKEGQNLHRSVEQHAGQITAARRCVKLELSRFYNRSKPNAIGERAAERDAVAVARHSGHLERKEKCALGSG